MHTNRYLVLLCVLNFAASCSCMVTNCHTTYKYVIVWNICILWFEPSIRIQSPVTMSQWAEPQRHMIIVSLYVCMCLCVCPLRFMQDVR